MTATTTATTKTTAATLQSEASPAPMSVGGPTSRKSEWRDPGFRVDYTGPTWSTGTWVRYSLIGSALYGIALFGMVPLSWVSGRTGIPIMSCNASWDWSWDAPARLLVLLTHSTCRPPQYNTYAELAGKLWRYLTASPAAVASKPAANAPSRTDAGGGGNQPRVSDADVAAGNSNPTR